MIAELGIVTLGLSFAAALFALLLALAGTHLRRDSFVVSARNAAMITFPLITVACGILVYALVNHEYSIVYVAETTDNATPDFYLYTALWGSQAGSLLFWSWLLSGFIAVALWLNWHSERRLMPYVIVASMATLGFFLFLNTFIENPFARFWELSNGTIKEAVFAPDGATIPEIRDGNGLSPLLRHLGMVIHPPMLYLGFVGFTIPFAFAFAALATGRLGSEWLRATRQWALVAWLFLSLGLILGGRWAYDVLGWGGYWGWDPVENAALLPWLTGTAFLHSAVVQEKRGMLKFWNMLLIILTFMLVILGTFATRSGVVSSVHAFAKSDIGPLMFGFLGVSMVASFVLLAWRQERGDMRGVDELDSLFSRESMFLLNNWLFLALTIVVLWGAWAEAITTIAVDLGLRDTIINLGPDYYPPVVRPFLIGIYILMGVAPLAAWRRSTAKRLGRSILVPTLIALATMLVVWANELAKRIDRRFGDNLLSFMWKESSTFVEESADLARGSGWAILGYGLVTFVAAATLLEIWKGVSARHGRGENYWVAFNRLIARDRRRYGGYFIHLGMVVLGLGVIGSAGFQQNFMETLNVGERLKLGDYTMEHNGFYWASTEDSRQSFIARVTLYEGGERVNPNDPTSKLYTGGTKIATIEPRRDIFADGTNSSIPGVHSSLANDFYVRIVEWDANRLTFRAYLNPLINFVWIGGFMLIGGTLIALWPSRRSSRAAQTVDLPGRARGEHAGAGR